jgi:PAS domain S-box-containing protein
MRSSAVRPEANKGGRSITARLSLYISLTIVVVCAAICSVYLSWEWSERKADLTRHVNWMAANTALLSREGFALRDKADLQKLVRNITDTEKSQHADPAVRQTGYVELLDPSGAPLASESYGMDKEDRHLMTGKRVLASGSSSPGSWTDYTAGGCGLYGAYYPVDYGGVRVGTVSVSVCDEPAKAELMKAVRDSALLLVAAGLMGVLIGRRISVWFSRPIGELVKGAGELSSGNLDYRVELDSYREMQILASSFNTMAWSLKEKLRSIESSRADALQLNEKLRQAYDEAKETSEKLEKLNEWATDMAFSLEEANQLLKEEMVQTRTIVHSIREGIVALDREDRIILLNPEAEELFGVKTEDIKGSGVKLLVDRLVDKIDDPEVFLNKFMASNSSPESENEFTITVVRPYKRVLRRHSSAIRRDDGEVIGRVVTFTDITRQKEVDDMKTNFVSTVSHELRTPLTSIKGALTLLQDEDITDEDTRNEFFSIAENNTDRLIALITNLLDLSRMESGMSVLKLSRFDMNGLVEDIVRSAAIAASRGGISLDTVFRAEKAELLADRAKIEQVVSNLVDNAVKFSPARGRVRVITELEEDGLLFAVEDDGPGIPGDKLEKVFDKFYQVDMSATRRVGGTGLGLAICKAVVIEHGGEIRAVSPVRTDGKGARFEVRLPYGGVAAHETARRSGPAVLESSSHAARGASRDTVLIVDDDESILTLQRKAFEKEGYRVLTAGTGREALLLARDNLPGFIFLDVKLPDLDGITVAGILKRDPATMDIPIVFATGELDEEQIRGLEFGMRVIKKPFFEKDLISAVREYYR